MIRRKRSQEDTGPRFPVWLITFADLVTRLMSFFVMLVSMASLTDVYKRKDVLGSVSDVFGSGSVRLDDLTTVHTNQTVEPGPINMFKDLEPVRKHLWDKPDSDLHFESNRFIQRLSMNADALFSPGSAELTADGRALLNRLRPFVTESAYPLGLSGHTGTGRDELGDKFRPQAGPAMDFSWRLSLQRVTAVYRYFVESGVAADKLRIEAFGQFRPKASNETPEGRKTNRRVDLTLDRRIGNWNAEAATQTAAPESGKDGGNTFKIKDFIFRFDIPQGK